MNLSNLFRRWTAPIRSAPAVNPSDALTQVQRNLPAGKPLRYLIGRDEPGEGQDNEIIAVGYDVMAPPAHGIGIASCNPEFSRRAAHRGLQLQQ